MIIYVNSITMCEMLYIWFHSELKKDAYIDEMSIENRMVELYHAHTDEDTRKQYQIVNLCHIYQSLATFVVEKVVIPRVLLYKCLESLVSSSV
jgi:hypothetical protein